MREPLVWNTLDEAAEWLAELTGESWNLRRVLDTALRFPLEGTYKNGPSNLKTAISAAIPHGHQTQAYILDTGEGRKEIEGSLHLLGIAKGRVCVPIHKLPWEPVILLQSHVHQVLAAKWVELTTAIRWCEEVYSDGLPRYWHAIEPPVIATTQILGIQRKELIRMAWCFATRDEEPNKLGNVPTIPREELDALQACFGDLRKKRLGEDEDGGLDAPMRPVAVSALAVSTTPEREKATPPAPLTTPVMAQAFDGILDLTEEKWRSKLGDVNNHQWLAAARVEQGKAPKPSKWNPCKLADLLLKRDVSSDALNRRFLEVPTLKPWLSVWQEAKQERNAFGR